MHIISLAPTQTEILAALDCRRQLIGITEDCDYPPDIQGVPTYGSWYSPDLPGILRAAPDLVCTFGKHQEEMAVTLHTEASLEVYHSDPGTVEESLEAIRKLAMLTDREEEGDLLLGKLRERLGRVRHRVQERRQRDHSRRPRVFRIMNWDPLITVGPGAFQHDVIKVAGGLNIMEQGPAPYFICDPDAVLERDPEVVFFCEPRILEQLMEDSRWKGSSAVRSGRICIFDCGLTCRSGPRIVDMVEALAEVLVGTSQE